MAELKVNDLAYHAWIRDLKAYYRQIQIGVVNLPQVVEFLLMFRENGLNFSHNRNYLCTEYKMTKKKDVNCLIC